MGANLKFFVIAYKKSSIICQRENYILMFASVKILSAAKTANISGVNMNCIAVRNIVRQKISAFVFLGMTCLRSNCLVGLRQTFPQAFPLINSRIFYKITVCSLTNRFYLRSVSNERYYYRSGQTDPRKI